MQWKEVLSSQIDALKKLGEEMQVNPLALEDCLHRDQRAKLEDYGNHQFLVWFLFNEGKIYELQFLIFPETLILVAHEKPPRGESWKEFLRINDQSRDMMHFLYQALDRITDISTTEARTLFQKIQDFEQKLFSGDAEIKWILPTRKKLSSIEMQMGHLSSIAMQLQNFFKPKDDLKWKFRDLHDHCERLYQSAVFNQGQIASAFDLYWAVSAQKTNLQIKKLTLIASISVPLTFWASFFGMNFEAIPFHNQNFFAAAIAIMVGSVIFTYFFLRVKGYWTNS